MAPRPNSVAKNTSHDEETIVDRLQREIEELPNALARIAKYILENPEKVLRQSVAELGEFSGSGEASVVRLCRQVGFSGFRDFKLALAADLGRSGVPALASADPDSALQALHASMAQSLDKAYGRIDPKTLDAVAEKLSVARRIDLYGAGMSGLITEMLAYRLLRAGLTVQLFRDANMAHELANGLGPDCVAVAFSVSGLTVDTLHFVKAAAAAGASTVAITNRARSPLGEAAQYTLQTARAHDGAIGGTLSTVTGQIFVIESLMLSLGRAMATQKPPLHK
ncbi:DNA-binding MurR/RpiR family transcriptional regulator [Mesorhizobium robiniae]|uniref:DNA-binding MurR/RpiR family transcriptional regulator n=1 Tax=Mesorhizobium robiniae TaxID=559315 RepID=A0ABV2GT58_9HYPH